MIRIQLIHEGRVVKQISSRLHESVILEQVKRYQDPVDTIVIVEGQLSEDAKGVLKHVAKKIIPAAMAAGIALGGAGSAQAQGGANPHYPGLNHSVGSVLSDIFSPNYRERVRQRDFERETQRREWNAQAQVDRQARVDAARQSARQQVGASSVKIYDQARLSQDGKSYILYDMENRVTRIPVQGTEFMNGDSQRLPHYITRNGSVYYVRHAAAAQPLRQSQFSEDIGTVGTIPAAGTAGKTEFAKTGSTTATKFNNKGQLELDTAELDDEAIAALKKAGVEIKEANSSELAAILDAHPEAVKAFKEGGDLSDFPDFYDELFEYYFNEMPYGVAKARDGDPINWISDRLQSELDLHQPMEARADDEDMDPDAATATDQATADKNIVMQIRKAADYEKPMALSLGDGSTQKIDALLAKKILGLFDGLKPQSKELMQNMLNTKEGFAKIIGHINEQEVKESLAEVDQIANGMTPVLEITKQAKIRARSIINAAYAQASE
jgi:hypothetical protein